jgi:hypothetical protein
MNTAPLPKSEQIRVLNDNLRSTFIGGTVVLTQGVDSLPANTKARLLAAVRSFSNFTKDNDPHGEHDFGAFELVGRTFFWKIEHYDAACEFGSEDPSDLAKTTRVLTIMLAS